MMRDILIAFSVKYQGNWEAVYKAISDKEKIEDSEVKELLESVKDCKVITIIDDNYPEKLKNCIRPPFAVFYKGNWDLITDKDPKILLTGESFSSLCANSNELESWMSEKVDTVMVSCNPEQQIQALTENLSEHALIEVLSKPVQEVSCALDEQDYLVLSEYPEGTTKSEDHIKWSNRIAAAICDKMIVTEAKRKGNIMNIVMWALKMGKDVGAMPTHISENSGTNYLIQQGADAIIDLSSFNEFIERETEENE